MEALAGQRQSLAICVCGLMPTVDRLKPLLQRAFLEPTLQRGFPCYFSVSHLYRIIFFCRRSNEKMRVVAQLRYVGVEALAGQRQSLAICVCGLMPTVDRLKPLLQRAFLEPTLQRGFPCYFSVSHLYRIIFFCRRSNEKMRVVAQLRYVGVEALAGQRQSLAICVCGLMPTVDRLKPLLQRIF